MVKVKIKETINLELRKGDEFEVTGKSAEDYINRLSNFPHYVEIVGSEHVEAHTELTETPQMDETKATEQVAPLDEKVADTVDYEAMTIPEIKAALTERGIEFDSRAVKADLINLLAAGE